MNTTIDRTREDLLAAADHAWADLGERIQRGLGTLDDLIDVAATAENRDRLLGKRTGLADARAEWADLQDRYAAAAGDGPLVAWRTFTDRIADRHRTAGMHQAIQTGLALALSYQRGYHEALDVSPQHWIGR